MWFVTSLSSIEGSVLFLKFIFTIAKANELVARAAFDVGRRGFRLSPRKLPTRASYLFMLKQF